MAKHTGKKITPKIKLHRGDLPAGASFTGPLAVDTEAMGLNPHRDRLCLVQMSAGDGVCHLVQMIDKPAPRLASVLADKKIEKIFHFARFDAAILYHTLGVMPVPLYCTRIASRLARTYTDRHGLRDLCRELLDIDISKQEQSSDWGADTLSQAQQAYAAGDVLYLHQLRAILDDMLKREGRDKLAAQCFAFIPTRVTLDLLGWDDDFFAHS
ncbi:MAG: ribonuclease D [Pseudomonadota bacterium]